MFRKLAASPVVIPDSALTRVIRPLPRVRGKVGWGQQALFALIPALDSSFQGRLWRRDGVLGRTSDTQQ